MNPPVCRPALIVITALGPLLLTPALGQAQGVPLQKVEVAGKADARRDDTAARIVVGREQLAQYGDTQLSAILKRQPGIALNGGEIRMRGLGAGYTQVLINGDPAPPGFALDSIAPALIERIDILRVGTAEVGAQAIAGSINIILKKAGGRTRREAKLGLGAGARPDPALALNWSGQANDVGYGLGAELARSGSDNDYTSDETAVRGAQTSRRVTREHAAPRTTRINLAPRLTWNSASGTLAWQALIEALRFSNQGDATETLLAGLPTAYPVNGFAAAVDTWSARTDLTWAHNLGDGKFSVKAAASRYVRDSDYVFRGAGATTLVRRVLSDVVDDSATLSAKYQAPLNSEHSVTLGWESGINRRDESRKQADSTFAALPLGALDEDYRADVTRLALFAQDEWTVLPRLQAYLGMRWESLRSTTRGRTLEQVRSDSGVASPISQLLWKVPGSDKGQVRLALARSYKAPPVRNLVPRRYTVNNGNSPTSPDVRGNPALRPELAWGLDLAYEHYFGKDAMASLAAYGKRIDQVTVQTLYLENGAWISTPFNHGRARVAGIEFDTRFSLGKVDLRANGARHWSRLDAVPGPHNRLAEQARITANLGLDVRWSDALTFGTSLNLQYGGPARLSASLRSDTGPLRTLDLFGLWKLDAATRLRLSATNALHPERNSGQAFVDAGISQHSRSSASTQAAVRLLVERGW